MGDGLVDVVEAEVMLYAHRLDPCQPPGVTWRVPAWFVTRRVGQESVMEIVVDGVEKRRRDCVCDTIADKCDI